VGIDIDLRKERLWQRKYSDQLPALEVSNVPKIAILSIFPGMDSTVLDSILKSPLQGLILKTYGAGNIPNNQEILDSLKKANERGVVIVNCSQCLYGSVKMDTYKAGHALIDIGVISGRDMTDEAALGKLFYLLSQPSMTQQQVKKAFKTSLQGEVSV
jgi:L-asparaginase